MMEFIGEDWVTQLNERLGEFSIFWCCLERELVYTV